MYISSFKMRFLTCLVFVLVAMDMCNSQDAPPPIFADPPPPIFAEPSPKDPATPAANSTTAAEPAAYVAKSNTTDTSSSVNATGEVAANETIKVAANETVNRNVTDNATETVSVNATTSNSSEISASDNVSNKTDSPTKNTTVAVDAASSANTTSNVTDDSVKASAEQTNNTGIAEKQSSTNETYVASDTPTSQDTTNNNVTTDTTLTIVKSTNNSEEVGNKTEPVQAALDKSAPIEKLAAIEPIILPPPPPLIPAIPKEVLTKDTTTDTKKHVDKKPADSSALELPSKVVEALPVILPEIPVEFLSRGKKTDKKEATVDATSSKGDDGNKTIGNETAQTTTPQVPVTAAKGATKEAGKDSSVVVFDTIIPIKRTDKKSSRRSKNGKKRRRKGKKKSKNGKKKVPKTSDKPVPVPVDLPQPPPSPVSEIVFEEKPGSTNVEISTSLDIVNTTVQPITTESQNTSVPEVTTAPDVAVTTESVTENVTEATVFSTSTSSSPSPTTTSANVSTTASLKIAEAKKTQPLTVIEPVLPPPDHPPPIFLNDIRPPVYTGPFKDAPSYLPGADKPSVPVTTTQPPPPPIFVPQRANLALQSPETSSPPSAPNTQYDQMGVAPHENDPRYMNTLELASFALRLRTGANQDQQSNTKAVGLQTYFPTTPKQMMTSTDAPTTTAETTTFTPVTSNIVPGISKDVYIPKDTPVSVESIQPVVRPIDRMPMDTRLPKTERIDPPIKHPAIKAIESQKQAPYQQVIKPKTRGINLPGVFGRMAAPLQGKRLGIQGRMATPLQEERMSVQGRMATPLQEQRTSKPFYDVNYLLSMIRPHIKTTETLSFLNQRPTVNERPQHPSPQPQSQPQPQSPPQPRLYPHEVQNALSQPTVTSKPWLGDMNLKETAVDQIATETGNAPAVFKNQRVAHSDTRPLGWKTSIDAQSFIDYNAAIRNAQQPNPNVALPAEVNPTLTAQVQVQPEPGGPSRYSPRGHVYGSSKRTSVANDTSQALRERFNRKWFNRDNPVQAEVAPVPPAPQIFTYPDPVMPIRPTTQRPTTTTTPETTVRSLFDLIFRIPPAARRAMTAQRQAANAGLTPAAKSQERIANQYQNTLLEQRQKFQQPSPLDKLQALVDHKRQMEQASMIGQQHLFSQFQQQQGQSQNIQGQVPQQPQPQVPEQQPFQQQQTQPQPQTVQQQPQTQQQQWQQPQPSTQWQEPQQQTQQQYPPQQQTPQQQMEQWLQQQQQPPQQNPVEQQYPLAAKIGQSETRNGQSGNNVLKHTFTPQVSSIQIFQAPAFRSRPRSAATNRLKPLRQHLEARSTRTANPQDRLLFPYELNTADAVVNNVQTTTQPLASFNYPNQPLDMVVASQFVQERAPIVQAIIETPAPTQPIIRTTTTMLPTPPPTADPNPPPIFDTKIQMTFMPMPKIDMITQKPDNKSVAGWNDPQIDSANYDDRCRGCVFVNDRCLLPDPVHCNIYIECVRQTTFVRAFTRECAMGSFFDRKSFLCVDPKNANCPTDRCREKGLKWYGIKGHCKHYWSCVIREGGGSYAQSECCPDMGGFVDGEGCISNENCTETCSSPVQLAGPKGCQLRKTPSPTVYFDENAKIERPCAPGTLFNERACTCVQDVSIERSTKQPGAQAGMNCTCANNTLCACSDAHPAYIPADTCIPLLALNFTNDKIEDSSHTKQHVGVEGVTVSREGAAIFNGAGRLVVWRYANLMFPLVFAMRFRFLSTSSEPRFQTIISNCDKNGASRPTFEISLDTLYKEVIFKVDTYEGPSKKFKIMYPHNKWTDVDVIYDGERVVGSVNRRARNIFAGGGIETRPQPIGIGACGKSGGIKGLVDDVYVYEECIPDELYGVFMSVLE